MRKSWWLLIPALLCPRPSAAQGTPVISGTITDTAGKPVEGVTVSLERSPDSWVRRNITDAKGHYVLVGVPTEGGYDLVARRLGYHDFRRPDTKGKAGHALIVNFTMFVNPVALDPVTVKAGRRVFRKQLAPVAAAEFRETSYIVTAFDIFRILRPYAFRVRKQECANYPWKIFVDSAQMDFSFGGSSAGIPAIPDFLRGARVATGAPGFPLDVPPAIAKVLRGIRAHEIELVEIHPCTHHWLPVRHWNSVWITTKRAYWLARKGPGGISGANPPTREKGTQPRG